VFLLPPAIAALASLPRRGEWVFPGRGGERRSHGTPPKQWHAWLRSAGITRRVRWHDLRHTCATSLLAGWWGRKWTLDEVCRFLGHSGIQVTERYARKLAETQRFAVDNTPGFVFPLGNLGAPKMLESKETTDRFVNRRSRVQISKAAPKRRTRAPGERGRGTRTRNEGAERGRERGRRGNGEDERAAWRDTRPRDRGRETRADEPEGSTEHPKRRRRFPFDWSYFALAAVREISRISCGESAWSTENSCYVPPPNSVRLGAPFRGLFPGASPVRRKKIS
jgi:hypothetical protein